jgi:putative transposase
MTHCCSLRPSPRPNRNKLSPATLAVGEPMVAPSAWRICSTHRLWSVFGKKRSKNGKVGPPVHDDLVERDFSAENPNRLCLSGTTEHPTREGNAILMRDRGCVLQPHRRLLHRLADEVTVDDHRPAQCGGAPRGGGWLNSPTDRGSPLSRRFMHALGRYEIVGSMGRVGAASDKGGGLKIRQPSRLIVVGGSFTASARLPETTSVAAVALLAAVPTESAVSRGLPNRPSPTRGVPV